MSARMCVTLLFCMLAWVSCAAFIVAAAYIHYVMNSSKDVSGLIFGAIIAASGASWLTNILVTGDKDAES